jgi:dCTP diphosphatase
VTSDEQTTVGELKQAVAAFVAARDWQAFHSPKNLAMSVSIEAAELMECFQWLTNEQSQAAVTDPGMRSAAADELADVLIYCLSLGNALGLDLATAVQAKLETNEARYPVDDFRGRFRKPERPR